jgi:hypothetical protein
MRLCERGASLTTRARKREGREPDEPDCPSCRKRRPGLPENESGQPAKQPDRKDRKASRSETATNSRDMQAGDREKAPLRQVEKVFKDGDSVETPNLNARPKHSLQSG